MHRCDNFLIYFGLHEVMTGPQGASISLLRVRMVSKSESEQHVYTIQLLLFKIAQSLAQ